MHIGNWQSCNPHAAPDCSRTCAAAAFSSSLNGATRARRHSRTCARPGSTSGIALARRWGRRRTPTRPRRRLLLGKQELRQQQTGQREANHACRDCKQVWRTYVLPGSALRLQRCKTRPWETSLANALFKCPSVAPGHYSNAYATASGPAPRHHRAHVAPTSRPAAKTTNSTRAFRRDLSNCISASATRSEQLTPKPVSGPEPPAGDCTQSPRTRTH